VRTGNRDFCRAHRRALRKGRRALQAGTLRLGRFVEVGTTCSRRTNGRGNQVTEIARKKRRYRHGSLERTRAI